MARALFTEGGLTIAKNSFGGLAIHVRFVAVQRQGQTQARDGGVARRFDAIVGFDGADNQIGAAGRSFKKRAAARGIGETFANGRGQTAGAFEVLGLEAGAIQIQARVREQRVVG